MKHEEKDIERIADYLGGTLSQEERNAVDQRLASDTAFRELFNETKLLATGIKMQGRQGVKKQLVDLEQTLPAIEIKKGRTMLPWISGVAAALLIFFLVYMLADRSDPKELFEAYYSPYPNIAMPVVRGEDQDSSARARAFIAYEQQDYLNAIAAFEALEHRSDEDKFYLGNSYLAAGEARHAIDVWLTLSPSASRYADQTLWYLSLAHLKLGESDEAITSLNKLLTHESSYTPRAKELLEQLHK
jgi:tetratricopeptide (TPR) repeat protein